MSKEKKRNSPKRTEEDLPPLEDVADVESSKSTVIYGLSATGKTTLLATWPKPLLLLDFNDRGTDSISDVRGIKVAKIQTIAELEAVYWALQKGKWKFKTVGFDTVTMMQDMFIQDITGSNEPMSWGTLSRRQFGEVSGGMKKTIIDFRDLETVDDVVFLAQQKVYKEEDEDNDHGDLPAEIGPALMPSVSLALNAAVNTIGQTYKRIKTEKKEVKGKIIKKDKIQFCLYIGPNPVRTTKIRKPRDVVPPSYLVDPTYKDLIEALKGEE